MTNASNTHLQPVTTEYVLQLAEWGQNHPAAGRTHREMIEHDERDAYDMDRERTAGPALPARAPGRAKIIAAIHAYADFLAEHGDIPAPQYITAYAHYRREDEPDEAMRIALVQAYADRQGIEMERVDSAVFADLRVASPLTHGIKINHSVLTVTGPERAL